MPFGQEDGQDDRGVAFGTSGVHDDWDFGVGSWHDREGIIDDALIEDKYGNWSTYTDSINPLAFGFFSPGNNGGTITVKPDGLSPPTLTNTVVIVTPPINSQGRGSFRIMGAVGKSYSVIGDDEITMNALDGVPPGKIGTMQADLVYWAQSTFNQGDTSTSGVLSVQAGGFTGDILGVGGTLTVPANVASGSWLGQFQVTAQYD